MIAPVNTNFASPSCQLTGCGQKSIPEIPGGAQHPAAKEDHARVSDRAREQFNTRTKEGAAFKSENDLNEEDRREVEKLKKRDREVKAHERAHMAAGAGVVMGGASYEYEHGPDGKTYAVGGEVKIDNSKENTPEATIRKMQQVRKAALAPAQPSARDRSVAAKAAQTEAEARIELQEQKAKSTEEDHRHAQTTPAGSTPNPFSGADNSPRTGHNLNVMI